ncbi:YfhO family protein [Marinilactibacillus kalidii]|uniref:YfhO family protein n=1 Tax=Marinilactibacillus kalidii TaxID=2820274 RepID=UPI001ABE4362|nr:YfhO family protein [Marinilactibacillus kalidii]
MSETNQSMHALITKRTLLNYTALFIMMMVAIFSYYFLVSGASFIWTTDGYTQHYLLFQDYLERLRGVFSGQGFALWDWTIGMGADVIQSYGYYVIGDPFVYLGLLFPASMTELAYHALIFLRIYCIGAAFLLYARKMHFSHDAGLAGAILYAFANYGIFSMSRHPFFVLSLIWFPLLCLGIEMILKKESSMPFTIIVTLSALSNFYFFYKLTILIFIYAIVRYLVVYKSERTFWKVFLSTTIAYIIGLMISAVVFIPIVYGFLQSSRSPGGIDINWFIYPLEYYLALLKHAISPGSYFWTIGGFSLFSFIALLSIKKKPGMTVVKIVLSILGLFLLFPFFGSFMNGLSGPYNRFSFVFAFFMALAGAYLIDQKDDLAPNAKKKSAILLIAYTILSLLSFFFPQVLTAYMLVPVVIGWAMWWVLFSNKRPNGWHKNTVILGLIILNMGMNTATYYYSFGGNMIANVLDYGTVDDRYEQALGGLETPMTGETSVDRTGVTSDDDQIKNQFIHLDTMGLNSYLSVSNGLISEFARALELSSYQTIQPLRNGLDDRTELNQFLGVQSIVTETENESLLPLGYEVAETNEEKTFIKAKTADAYPLAYAVDQGLSTSRFMEFNAIQRETLLSRGAILEKGDMKTAKLQQMDTATNIVDVPYTLDLSEETPVTLTDQYYVTEGQGIDLTLTVDTTELLNHAELYVRLDGLDYHPLNASPLIRQQTNYRVIASNGETEKSVYQADRYSFSSYFKRNSMLINLGYEEERTDNKVHIHFNRPGKYAIDTIKLFAKPLDENRLTETAAPAKAHEMEITKFENGTVEGTVNSADNEMLVTTIPYSIGWEATRNGEPIETVKANIGFIGLPLIEGENTITLTYKTPFLTLGYILSLSGLIILAAQQFFYFKIKSKK